MSRQKRKGDGYERELAKWLDDQLYGGGGQIQRAMLSGGGRNLGGGGMADLVGTPHIWVEAKRTEKFKPYEAIEQAETGIDKSNSRDIPIVMQRRNQMKTEDSLVVAVTCENDCEGFEDYTLTINVSANGNTMTLVEKYRCGPRFSA